MMKNNVLIHYVKECEKEYKMFMGITDFPEYEIVSKEISLKKADAKGFEAPGTASYDIPTGKHTLALWSLVETKGTAGKSIVFHELTHILDDEKYVNKDKIRYMTNHGYTEYHAAQIEMMQLLGAKRLSEKLSFSMDKVLDTIMGNKSVKEYVEMAHRQAVDLITRSDFPADIDTLKSTLGIIFNYYGRRSICKMYAEDFQDYQDNSAIEKLITTQMINALNGFMTGWFDRIKIDKINEVYQNIVLFLIKKYALY